MSKEFRNEVSGVRSEDLNKCTSIMQQLRESIRGDKSFEDAWKDELYRSVYRLEIESFKRSSRHELKRLAYMEELSSRKLVNALFDRMAKYYHKGYVEGESLHGISWSVERDGTFVVTLNECAINMERSFRDCHCYTSEQTKTILSVWLDVPDMDDADISAGSYGDYYKYVGFTCDYEGVRKDVVIDNEFYLYLNRDLLRDILADFDLIDEMAGRELAEED